MMVQVQPMPTTTNGEHIVEEKAIVPPKTSKSYEKNETDEEGGLSLQQELNEILEAWFELVPEDDVMAYQEFVEEIRGEKVAERALKEPSIAPFFELTDQDGDVINSRELLLEQKKPLVLVFYRGKWCPQCNCTLMHYAKKLRPELEKRNAKLIGISPMRPDGSKLLATKKNIDFSVCSDLNGQKVARQFGITFTVSPKSQEYMTKWGEHLPSHNADGDWEIPIPAVYLIGTDGRIVWSFLDNDPGTRAEPQQIINALDAYSVSKGFRAKLLAARGISSPSGQQQESQDIKRTSDHSKPCYQILGRDCQDLTVNKTQDDPEENTDSSAEIPVVVTEKEFNRKVGLITRMRRRTLSIFKKKNKKQNNTSDDDAKSEADLRSVSSNGSRSTSGYSIKSDNRLPRVYRGEEQPPMEFLMTYVGGLH